MLVSLEDYLELIEQDAVAEGLADFRLAREEFHNLTGKFEDGEPWFELRMTMFIDWYLLDRKGLYQMTPLERFLTVRGKELAPAEHDQMVHLASSLRSCFLVLDVKNSQMKLEDLTQGSHWLIESTMPTVGLAKGDILNSRIVFFDGRPTMGRGTVLHPQEAHEAIRDIIARAKAESMAPRQLSDHLDKMRLKLDRYSSVRIQHVYRYPDDANF